MTVIARCVPCRDDLDHCHGLLVIHLDGHTECLGDEPCAGDRARHDWTVAADELVDAAA